MNSQQIKKIQLIWDNYIKSNKQVLDTKGKEISDIDSNRNEAIVQLKEIIEQFNKGESNIYEFKTNIDSFNKRNNLSGKHSEKGGFDIYNTFSFVISILGNSTSSSINLSHPIHFLFFS